MDEPDSHPSRRVRHIDWRLALTELERLPAGTPVLVGRLNRSIATFINRGQYSYIDPTRYTAWSKDWNGKTSEIWIRRNQ
jgi:hypothetical protein